MLLLPLLASTLILSGKEDTKELVRRDLQDHSWEIQAIYEPFAMLGLTTFFFPGFETYQPSRQGSGFQISGFLLRRFGLRYSYANGESYANSGNIRFGPKGDYYSFDVDLEAHSLGLTLQSTWLDTPYFEWVGYLEAGYEWIDHDERIQLSDGDLEALNSSGSGVLFAGSSGPYFGVGMNLKIAKHFLLDVRSGFSKREADLVHSSLKEYIEDQSAVDAYLKIGVGGYWRGLF